MTSKEALEHLINDCMFIFWYDNSSKAIDIIKQDLEILDTLKDNIYFKIYDNEPNKLYVAENQIDITGKEKLIKEWLNRE